MPDHDAFTQSLSAAARTLEGERGSQDVMDRAVLLASEVVSGCDMAAVSVVHPQGRIDSPATSHAGLRVVDEYQYELQEGPCLTALLERETVTSGDIATDPRWPRWGARVVAEMGLHSVLSFRLFASGESLSIALAGGQHVPLEAAIESRTVIGQATGILMERFDLAPDLAFGVLARMSQDSNVKVHELAARLVRTRVFPAR